MVNFKELLGNNNQLQNLLLDTVEEGEVYRLCLTKEEGIIPKNKGDEGRKKFFVVVGKDQEGNAIGFVLINSEINKHLPESRRKLHYLLKASEYEFWVTKIDLSIALILKEFQRNDLQNCFQ